MERIFKYHRINTPIPDGWVLCGDFGNSSHSKYAVIIEYIGNEHDDIRKEHQTDTPS